MSYAIEWMPAAVFLGLVALLSAPYFGLLVGMAVLVVVVLVAATALVALAGAVVAAPYLLGRSVMGRLRAWAATDRSWHTPDRVRARRPDRIGLRTVSHQSGSGAGLQR